MQRQIAIVERQVKDINDGQAELQARINRMRQLMADTQSEISGNDARIHGINALTLYLRELTRFGFGETSGQWILRNPAMDTSVLLVLVFFLLMLWLFWRIRQRQYEQAMSMEIDRVIRRLSKQAGQEQQARQEKPAAPRPVVAPAEKKPPRTADEGGARREIKAENAEPKKSSAEARPAPAPEAEKKEASGSEAGPKNAAASKAQTGRRPRKTARKNGERRGSAKKCKVKGCNNKHRSKGFCNKHYQQWRKGVLEQEIEED